VDQPLLESLLDTARWLQVRGLYEASPEPKEAQQQPECRLPVAPTTPLDTPLIPSIVGSLSPTSHTESAPSRKRMRSSQASPPQLAPARSPKISPRGASPAKANSSASPAKVARSMAAATANACWTVQPRLGAIRQAEEVKHRQELEEELGEEEQEEEEEEEEEECDQKSMIPDIPALLNMGGRGAADFFSHFNADNRHQQQMLLDSPLVGEQMLQAMQLCGNPYFSQLAALQQHQQQQQQNSCKASASPLSAASFTGTFTTSFAAAGCGRPSSPDLKAGILGSAPVRRYKQYTEDTLQAALKEIMAGQSINRSSLKHNIPARTLRDWMKRLNIKSVYTHHPRGEKEGSVGSCSPEPPELSVHLSEAGYPGGGYSPVFPGLLRAAAAAVVSAAARPTDMDEEEEEEEEEENLKIDEAAGGPDSFQKIAQAAV
jgi:helix-turn-helix, Psq domain